MSDHPLTYIQVDLAAIRFNLGQIRQHIGPKVLLMPVVKANAYGHGAVEVAQAVVAAGADRLAVNRIDEGVALRRAGITAPILVMGYCLPVDLPQAVEYDLIPTITELEGARAVSAAALRPQAVHIKVDTGMGRLGILPHEALDFVRAVGALSMIQVEGVYTHFSVADSPHPDDQAYTRRQFATFQEVLATFDVAGIAVVLRHVANSAATLYYPEMHLDAVRPGIAVYGLRPDASHRPPFELHPALSLMSQVGRVRTLPVGASISYGRTYTTSKPTRVALVPVGYGDGYPRLLSNRGAVLIRGQRAPIVGRVCMDQFIVDVSAIEGVALHDGVVLIGSQNGAQISVDEVAVWANTINYEITTGLLARPSRRYLNR